MKSKQQNSCNTVFPRDIVCLRNMSINTLHIGDDDNDNNLIIIIMAIIIKQTIILSFTASRVLLDRCSFLYFSSKIASIETQSNGAVN